MPKELDEIEDLPSSEQAEDDDLISDLADDAGSSTAADDAPKERSTQDIVRDVVSAEQPAPEAEPGSSPDGEEATADAAAKQPDNENYSDVPFNKHPRFRELLSQKKAAEVDAIRYRNIETFLDSNGMTAEEAADMLQVAAMAKTNPVEAWAKIKPWVEQVAIAAGAIVPPDLQQRMQNGELTREAAIEIAKTRAQVQSMQTRQQLQEQQAQRRAAEAAQTAIITAASSWEADRRAKDPNFDAKMPALEREIAYLFATEGRPTTPQGVIEQCQRAYQAVNAAFRAPAPARAPQPKAVRPVTGGQVAGTAAASPNSTLDIIRAHRRSG